MTREYDDKTYEDNFTVIRRYQTKVDNEGKCYDWYEIDDHYQVRERFTPDKQNSIDTAIEKQRGDIDYIAMISDIDLDTEVDDE